MEGQERGDEEDVKCSTFTHLLLYCRSPRERGERKKTKKKQKANGPGCKDAGLPSLVHQPASQPASRPRWDPPAAEDVLTPPSEPSWPRPPVFLLPSPTFFFLLSVFAPSPLLPSRRCRNVGR